MKLIQTMINNLVKTDNKITEKDINDLKIEHRIMKRIIKENGLWETLLNDDEFNKYLREDYNGK